MGSRGGELRRELQASQLDRRSRSRNTLTRSSMSLRDRTLTETADGKRVREVSDLPFCSRRFLPLARGCVVLKKGTVEGKGEQIYTGGKPLT